MEYSHPIPQDQYYKDTEQLKIHHLNLAPLYPSSNQHNIDNPISAEDK